MEYQNLVLYPKVYPSIDSYGRTLDGTFAIAGKYEQDNVKRYGLPNLNELVAVENTSFRFILAIKESDAVDETQYFTSEIFFDDLLASITENNPYFINNAINPNLFVNISLDNQKRLFNDLKLIDLATGVKQNQNVFLLNDNSIDYTTLVQYIDWVVSKGNLLDDESNGVLPAEKISDYEIGEYDPKTGEFTPDSTKTLALANRLQLLLEELADLEEAISGITNDMPAEPQKRKTSALDIIGLGLGALSVFQGVKAATNLAKGIKAANAAALAAKQSAAVTNSLAALQPAPALQLTTPPGYTSVFDIGNSSLGFTNNAVTLGGGVSSATQTVASTATSITTETTKKVIEKANAFKKIYNGAKSGIAAAGKAVGKASEFVGKNVAKGSKLINKAIQTPVGQTILTSAGQSAAALATANIKEEKTKAILGAVTKTAAIEVGKVVVKAVAKKVAGAAIGKLIGAATGPIGAGIMAAVGIVKFFVGKAKAKKEYNKQKAEFDKINSELERLIKRKEDVEFEIQNIMKSGKLTSDGKPKGDDRFSATQKYFQNIGKNILERQQQTQLQPQLQPVAQTVETPIIRNPGRPLRGFRNNRG